MTGHIDFADPSRQAVAVRARDARAYLIGARIRLRERGYVQIRFDQYEHPETKILVETGYTYGETRLVVHVPTRGYVSSVVTDLRLCGTFDPSKQDPKFDKFERLIAA